ncbi:hypothetical protein L0F63_001042 [Massospora cicadina]|nr:hypothetical protein L0F63_001042 [Massospora cicadina]
MFRATPSLTKAKRAVSEIVNLAPDAACIANLAPIDTIKLYCRGGDYQVEAMAEYLMLRYARKHSQQDRKVEIALGYGWSVASVEPMVSVSWVVFRRAKLFPSQPILIIARCKKVVAPYLLRAFMSATLRLELKARMLCFGCIFSFILSIEVWATFALLISAVKFWGAFGGLAEICTVHFGKTLALPHFLGPFGEGSRGLPKKAGATVPFPSLKNPTQVKTKKPDLPGGAGGGIGGLLARCQAFQLHTTDSDGLDSEVEFEEVTDCPIEPVDKRLQPWEVIEASVCGAATQAPSPRAVSNLVKRKRPSGLQRLNSKLLKLRGSR